MYSSLPSLRLHLDAPVGDGDEGRGAPGHRLGRCRKLTTVAVADSPGLQLLLQTLEALLLGHAVRFSRDEGEVWDVARVACDGVDNAFEW